MKLLLGSELVGFIKERQAKQVRRIVQENGIKPKLAIIVTINDPVIEIYLKLKKRYGEDIGIEVELHRLDDYASVKRAIKALNSDKNVHGVIIQLPVFEPDKTDEIVNLVEPEKDVDGLGEKTKFHPATPLAILWLLSGYNIALSGKNIVIVGRGRLVGRPLEKAFLSQGLTPKVLNKNTKNIKQELLTADIIITATGVPGLITSDMLKPGVVVIDAGTASEKGKTLGDVAEEVYQNRADISITPQKGGVGPLTVCALFDNLIQAAEKAKAS